MEYVLKYQGQLHTLFFTGQLAGRTPCKLTLTRPGVLPQRIGDGGDALSQLQRKGSTFLPTYMKAPAATMKALAREHQGQH